MTKRHGDEEHWTDGGAQAEGWMRWLCPGDVCGGRVWSVRAEAGLAELWLVGEASEKRTWLVAATTPCCPLCGDTLQPMEAEPEPDLGPFAALIATLK